MLLTGIWDEATEVCRQEIHEGYKTGYKTEFPLILLSCLTLSAVEPLQFCGSEAESISHIVEAIVN